MTPRSGVTILALAALAACESRAADLAVESRLSLQVMAAAGFTSSADAEIIHLEGPTPRTLSILPGQVLAIPDLEPGDYAVSLEAFVGGTGGRLESFGQTTVTLVAGEDRQANITLTSFIPTGLTAPSEVRAGKPLVVAFDGVEGATSYVVEVADNPDFSNVRAVEVDGPPADITIAAEGTYYIRIFARDRFGSSGIPATTAQVLVRPPTFTVSGSVRYSAGAVQGVDVGLIRDPDSEPYATLSSGADGGFAFADVWPGRYIIRAEGPANFNPALCEVVVSTQDIVQDVQLTRVLVLSAPDPGSMVDAQPTLSWQVNAEASAGGHYRIRIYRTRDNALVEDVTTGATATYTLATPLTPGYTYMWAVRAYDSAERPVGDSNTDFDFTVPLGRWSNAGDLRSGEANAVAVVLDDGRVLVVGRQSQIFDPTTGAGTILNSAPTRHGQGATATLLPDGRVLIAGGALAGQAAEIFNPTTRTFAQVGPMLYSRAFHSATLLNDGRVLLAGGNYTGDGGLVGRAEAEIFTPGTNRFTGTAAAMSTDRVGHTAQRLPDGRVLIVGGAHTTSPGYAVRLRSAEIYEPNTDEFVETGSLDMSPIEPQSVLLANGSILVAGGGASEIYDPESGTFIRRANTAFPHSFGVLVTTSEGRAVMTAGIGNEGDPTDAAEIYDPTSGQWLRAANMSVPRMSHMAVTLPDGRVLVLGGSGIGAASSEWFTSAELFTIGS